MNSRKIESIISAYKILRRDNPDSWIIDCSNSKSLEQAIELAATARNLSNKKHSHQYRIPNDALNDFSTAIIENIESIRVAESFDELIEMIDTLKSKGISDLTVYDTAQRLGTYLGLFPERIYLHRGAREGAEILLGRIKERSIDMEQLPEPFLNSDLTAGEIEDILCIYKSRLSSCV